MARRRSAVCAAVAALSMVAAVAAPPMQSPPEIISTPTLRQAPSSGPYIDPVFDYRKMNDADIVYGENVNSRGEVQQLLLDVWEPVGDASSPALGRLPDHARARGVREPRRPAYISIRGGGFIRMDKELTNRRDIELLRRGYVVVKMTYRIDPDMPGDFYNLVTEDPTLLVAYRQAILDATEDAKAAVRWVREHADEYGIDPDKIAIGGSSAGGIMALGVAFDWEDPGSSNDIDQPGHVAAAISIVGGYIPLTQGDPGDIIRPGDPPIMVLSGTHDVSVPAPANLAACALTLAVGNVCESHTYVGQGHDLPADGDHSIDAHVSFLYRQVVDPRPFPFDR